MASQEPTEDEIWNVIDFANLNPQHDRPMIIQALKDNSRNVESVVIQYFDDPAAFRQKFSRTWNDGMFSADRDGSGNYSGLSSSSAFHIESLEQSEVIQGVAPTSSTGYVPTAPSRPPSRSNDRSPLGRMVDWTAGVDDLAAAKSQSIVDEDMRRALRESAQEVGVSMPSGPGPTANKASTSTPFFGPANRSEYDHDRWSVVPASGKMTAASAPSWRRRSRGAPALLIQGPNNSSGDHRLGGLLTILHQIPLARNVLLQSGLAAATYGFNSEWWKGQEILPPYSPAEASSGLAAWGGARSASAKCDEELHRLMAFLDLTERSHGSVSLLADSISYSSLGPEKQFYEHLEQLHAEVTAPLTQVVSLAHVRGEDIGEEEVRFGLLEMEHLRTDYSNIRTLYESLDHIMWSDVLSWNEMNDESKMAMFRNMGEVLTIKFGGDGPEQSIEIPQELYPERYLASRKDEARRIQRGWCETKTAIAKVAERELELREWRRGWDKGACDKRELLQKAKRQWKACADYLESRGRFRGMTASGFDTHRHPNYRAAPCQMDEAELGLYGSVEEVLKLTQRALVEIDKKLNDLKATLERTRAKQRFLGRLLTVPDKEGRPKRMACKRYLLRGIATSTDTVYVCQRLERPLVELEGEAKGGDGWWRLSYRPQAEPEVSAERMEVQQVLRQVWQETKTPLLVYATEKALDTERSRLSGPLDRFVRADNKAFRQELEQEEAEVAGGTAMEPISPSKRKHRSDSMDSMDSNRASMGSDDCGREEKGMEEEQEEEEEEEEEKKGGEEKEEGRSRGVGGGDGGLVHLFDGDEDGKRRAGVVGFDAETGQARLGGAMSGEATVASQGRVAQEEGGEERRVE